MTIIEFVTHFYRFFFTWDGFNLLFNQPQTEEDKKLKDLLFLY